MKTTPTLNEIFKTITSALNIKKPDQVELFRTAGEFFTTSMVDGFWRKPDDSRAKTLRFQSLRRYLGALELQLTESAGEGDAAQQLEELIAKIDAGDDITGADLQYWEALIQARHAQGS